MFAKKMFLTRQGGVSKGIYTSLNCAAGSDDDPVAVAENRRRVVRKLTSGHTDVPLLTLQQIHSNKCVVADRPWSDGQEPEADALVTERADIVLGVLTADCGPVLLAGEKADGRPVIGAAHAGWGGALTGVLENTVATMRGLGTQYISAALGPCIGPESYEVGPEFRNRFLQDAAGNKRFFQAGKAGKFFFDLPAYIVNSLNEAGVDKVSTDFCADTYQNPDLYFSHRRSVHWQDPDYGRQISVITIMR